MQPSKWLAGLAPCLILLLSLSLLVADVESKKGQRRQRGGKQRGRQGPKGKDPAGAPIFQKGQGQGQRGGNGTSKNFPITGPNDKACPNTPPFGDVKANITELWKEVRLLSNPIHIHVHGGSSSHGRHSSHGFMGRKGRHSSHGRFPGGGRSSHSHGRFPFGRHSSHGPGGKRPHSHSPGGKRRHHSHGPKGKGTPGGKGGKGRPHPHSPAGKGRPTPGGKGPGRSRYSHRWSSRSHSTRETHIHVHVTLDNNENEHHNFMEKYFDDYQYARCDLMAPEKGSTVTGTVLMRQMFHEPVQIKVNISGMAAYRPVGIAADQTCQHAIHVHEFADFSKGCMSFGAHYNPKNTTHGPDNDDESHAGDWGNIDCDKDGNCVANMNMTNTKLLGPSSIIGRGIVLHALKDDLGKGGDAESLLTGNAGKRIACCGVVRTGPPSEDDW